MVANKTELLYNKKTKKSLGMKMIRKPLVAIVGRPNVGKSTFFNRIAGKRISIVQNEPGVTRDRIYADAEWCGHAFTMIDTGGIELKTNDEMYKHILKQVDIAVSMADVILFFVDGKQGLVASDYDVAKMLRKSQKKVILVVNKLDNFNIEATYDFFALGLGEPIAISAEQAKGLGDLLDEVVKHFPVKADPFEENDTIRIAVVGKPNVGKSSIINKLIGEERLIVSDISGTTRDAVDVPFNYNKKKYTLIDTAGMRRKRSIEDESVERYSIFRTLDSIRRADVVIVVFDSGEVLTEQDVRIAGLVHEQNKPSVIVMNKWDLIEKQTNTMNKFNETLKIELAYMSYFNSVYLSALTGKRIEKLMQAVEQVYENAGKRIKTGILNDIIQNALVTVAAPSKSGKRLKIYYATQTGTFPPTFVLFVNDSLLVTDSYLRYIENNIRKSVDFSGTPIKLVVKNKAEDV